MQTSDVVQTDSTCRLHLGVINWRVNCIVNWVHELFVVVFLVRPVVTIQSAKDSDDLPNECYCKNIVCATWSAVQCFALSSVSKAARLIKKIS